MAAIYGELIKAQLENLSADPSPASTGLVYWNTVSNTARIYDGSSWQNLGSGSSTATTNVRASEGGGTVTLINTDNHNQLFDLSSAETVVLPTTGVSKGDIWNIGSQPNGFDLTVQADDLSTIATFDFGNIILIALVNSPATASDWLIAVFTGDYLENVGNGASLASGNWVDSLTLTLPIGDWDVTGIMTMVVTSPPAPVTFIAAVSLFSGNTITDHVGGSNEIPVTPPTTTSNSTSTVANYRIKRTSSATIYLKTYQVSSGSAVSLGRISARRAR